MAKRILAGMDRGTISVSVWHLFIGLLFNGISLKMFFSYSFRAGGLCLDTDSNVTTSSLYLLLIALINWIIYGAMFLLKHVTVKRPLFKQYLLAVNQEYRKNVKKHPKAIIKKESRSNRKHGYTVLLEIEAERGRILDAVNEAGYVIFRWYSGFGVKMRAATILQGERTYEYATPSTATTERLFEDVCASVAGYISTKMYINQLNVNQKLEENSVGHCRINYQLTFELAKRHPKTAMPEKLDSLENIPESTTNVVKFLVRRTRQATTSILEAHRKMILKVSVELLVKKGLTYNQLKDILGPQKQDEFTLFEKFCMDGSKFGYPNNCKRAFGSSHGIKSGFEPGIGQGITQGKERGRDENTTEVTTGNSTAKIYCPEIKNIHGKSLRIIKNPCSD